LDASNSDAIIELKEVHSGYGEIKILKGINFSSMKGTITSVIGANGAGKSTLLKTIFGTVPVSAGNMFFQGRDITKTGSAERLKRGIAIVQQGRCNFPLMTVRENLEMGAFVRNDDGVEADIQKMFDHFDVLRRKQGMNAGNLSGGEQQMLEMSMALMTHPKLILLDEPSLGLSPLMVEEVFSSIRQLADTSGTAVVMVEQNAVQALKISDQGIVVELGRVSITGSGPEMIGNATVRKAYLGLPDV
jgi:branched-chain amino acid transport system ATP-binding protein